MASKVVIFLAVIMVASCFPMDQTDGDEGGDMGNQQGEQSRAVEKMIRELAEERFLDWTLRQSCAKCTCDRLDKSKDWQKQCKEKGSKNCCHLAFLTSCCDWSKCDGCPATGYESCSYEQNVCDINFEDGER